MKFDFPVLFYKIFLIILFCSQLYPLIFGIGDEFTILINVVLVVYLGFRYYMLVRLKNEANKVSLTVTEFIIMNRSQLKNFKKDELCEKCRVKF